MNLATNRLLRRRYPARMDASDGHALAREPAPVERDFEYTEGSGQECPCVIVPQLLIAMGARNAARMHKKGEGNNGWSVQDWRDHLSDEERYYFPMLLRVAAALEASGCATCAVNAAGIRNAVARLGREHGEVRRGYLDRDQVPPKAVTRIHGLVEDALIMKYEKEIRREIKRMRREERLAA